MSDEVQELAHGESRLDRVPELHVQAKDVAVAPTLPVPRDDPGGREVGDDLLDGTLGDADSGGNILQQDVRVIGEADQDVSVIGEESPSFTCHASSVIRYANCSTANRDNRIAPNLPGTGSKGRYGVLQSSSRAPFATFTIGGPSIGESAETLLTQGNSLVRIM